MSVPNTSLPRLNNATSLDVNHGLNNSLDSKHWDLGTIADLPISMLSVLGRNTFTLPHLTASSPAHIAWRTHGKFQFNSIPYSSLLCMLSFKFALSSGFADLTLTELVFGLAGTEYGMGLVSLNCSPNKESVRVWYCIPSSISLQHANTDTHVNLDSIVDVNAHTVKQLIAILTEVLI
jgi:hypothetical protein